MARRKLSPGIPGSSISSPIEESGRASWPIKNLISHLDEFQRGRLNWLREELTQLPDKVDQIRRDRQQLSSYVPTDNEHVQSAIEIWKRTARIQRDFARWQKELDDFVFITLTNSIHSRRTSELVETDNVSLLVEIDDAKELINNCRAFVTAAARHRGIIGAGAALSDDAIRELDFMTRAPATPPIPPPHFTGGTEGDPSQADPFCALRQFACSQLKGQERAVIEALCNSSGKMRIVDIAVIPGIDWEDEIEGFKNVQKRLKPKLKRNEWDLIRQNNTAILKSIGGG